MKKKKRLIWYLYPSYLLITLISLAAASFYASNSLHHFLINRTGLDLQTRGKLLESQIAEHISPINLKAIDDLCKEIGKNASTRITIILPNGRVAGDSEKNPDAMDNHADRPEFLESSTGAPSSSIRYSRTLEKRMMYAAIPHFVEGKIKAIIRISIPLTSIDSEIKSIQLKIAFGGLFIAFLAAGISLYISRRISRPIEQMKQGAERFSNGNLEHRLLTTGTKELSGLANAMNQMAAQLKERIAAVINQRNEIEAILSCMLEGIIALDTKETILTMNAAAEKMFKGTVKEFKGRSIQELIRHKKLYHFIRQTLSGEETIQGDIVLTVDKEFILNVHITPLYNVDKELIGALIVINDVTQLRHLEQIRRDFVANVSHEIKTPLTAIIGFVETLQGGAIYKPEKATQFLGIIEKHVHRLSAIVEDLLDLSRIEQNAEQKISFLEKCELKNIIQTSLFLCREKSLAKDLETKMICEEGFIVKADSRLLEQAFVNLLDNAIKYSKKDDTITVNAEQTDSETIIHFKDQGIGVPKKHHPRLFERFYSVDPSRSREMGGTGLGLAIVKHIINTHNGHISVESSPGKGSTFSVHLPKV